MKTKIMFAILTTVILAQSAQADFVCTSNDGLSHLAVHPVTNQRLNAEVLLEKEGKEISFGALLLSSSVTGPLFQKFDYKLFGFTQLPATLTVVARQMVGRGGCGRGGCNNGTKIITAKFQQENTEIDFVCHEENL